MAGSFMQSLVIPLIADIPELFAVTKGDSAWILTSTLLAAAIATPLTGRLGDLYGKRRVLLPLVGVVIVGSVIASVGQDLPTIIVGRSLQGAMVGVVPLGISVLRDLLPRERLGSAVALVSSSLGIGGALGFPLSAVIYHYLGWRSLFVTGLIISALVLVLLVVFVPGDPGSRAGSFDFVGAMLLAGSLVGLLLLISKWADWGFSAPSAIAGGSGVILLLAWLRWELRRDSPLVDLRLAVRPALLLTNLSAAAMGFSVFGFQIITPIVVQLPPASGVGLGQSVVVAGLCLMPAGLMMLTFSPIGARVSHRFGAVASMAIGCGIDGIAYLAAPFAIDSLLSIAAISLGLGIGFGFTFGAIPTLVMDVVPRSQSAEGNGLNSLVRSVGSSVGSTVYAVILGGFAIVYGGHLQPTRMGIDLAYILAGIVMLVGAVLALLIPAARRREERLR